jgi:hypothetical protein
MIKLYLILAIVLFITLFAYLIIKFLKRLTMFTLQTTVDFNQLITGQAVQDTQLQNIAAVTAELTANVQPALDLVTSTQAQLVLDQEAIVAAQAVLDAANAKLAADQIIADAALTMYQLVSVDLDAWTKGQNDLLDDAANVVTLQDIYSRNGGV